MLGTIWAKLVHIFLPLLLLTVAFVGSYSLANWYLVAPGLVPIDQEVANFWLPGALGVILVATVIAPRLHVLKLSEKRNVPLLYQIAAVAVLVAPACFAQSYVTTASGTLTRVRSADMIGAAARTKYYIADAVCIDRQHPLIRRTNWVEGRNNEYLWFKLNVLVPVCGTAPRTVWIGLTFTDSVSNADARSVKEAEYRDFLARSEKEFDAFDPMRVQYFEVPGRTSDRRNFEKTLSEDRAAPQSSQIILVPHLDSFEARNGQALSWAYRSFGIAAGVFLVLLLIPGLDRKKLTEARLPRSQRESREPSPWLTLLVPRPDAFGLPVLFDINLGVYLVMAFSGLGVMSFQTEDLRAWGANYGPAIHGLGVYRLITSQFVHGGLMHIASNLYGLTVAGLFLSPVFRKMGLIVCYLLCGLGGGIASLVIHPALTSVGASGAIMGLWGITIVLALFGDKRMSGTRKMLLLNCLLFAGLTLAQGVSNPGIDNAAHVGGLLTGAVIGVLVFVFSWGEKLQTHPEPQAEPGVRVPATY